MTGQQNLCTHTMYAFNQFTLFLNHFLICYDFFRIAFGKGIKTFLSKECRDGKQCVREARKLRRSGDEKSARKKFDEAINTLAQALALNPNYADANYYIAQAMLQKIERTVNADENLSMADYKDDLLKAAKNINGKIHFKACERR